MPSRQSPAAHRPSLRANEVPQVLIKGSEAEVVSAPAGPTPVFEVRGGTAGLAAGEEIVLHLTLEPGRYVLLCFLPDLALGKEHDHLGMVRALEAYAGGSGT